MAHKSHSDCTRRSAPSRFCLRAWIHRNFDESPKAGKFSWAYYASDAVCVVVIPGPNVVNPLGIEYLGWIGD